MLSIHQPHATLTSTKWLPWNSHLIQTDALFYAISQYFHGWARCYRICWKWQKCRLKTVNSSCIMGQMIWFKLDLAIGSIYRSFETKVSIYRGWYEKQDFMVSCWYAKMYIGIWVSIWKLVVKLKYILCENKISFRFLLYRWFSKEYQFKE